MTIEQERRIVQHFVRLSNAMSLYDISDEEYDKLTQNFDERANVHGYVRMDEQWVTKEYMDSRNGIDEDLDANLLAVIDELRRDIESEQAANASRDPMRMVEQEFKYIHDAHTPDDEEWKRFLEFANSDSGTNLSPQEYRGHLHAMWDQWRTRSIDECIDFSVFDDNVSSINDYKGDQQ